MKHAAAVSVLFSIAMGVSSQVSALDCFLTVVKDSCWTDFDVNVKMTNADEGKQILSITVPKGKSWSREKFTCDAGESLSYMATFSPVFWAADKGKQYPGIKFWKLPEQMKAGDTAWNITVCYPEQFSEVPLPPSARGTCKCDARNIPAVVVPEKK